MTKHFPTRTFSTASHWIVTLGIAASLVIACNSGGDREDPNGGSGTTPAPPPSATSPAEALPTEQTTGSIRPAEPTATPQPLDYEAFLAQRGLVFGEPPVEADLTGDGEPETLLNAHATECVSCHARSFFVLSGEDVLFEGQGAGWLTPQEDDRSFEWLMPLGIPGEPLCCPSWFAVETYAWSGSQFVLGEVVGLQHFQEVNEMPLTQPLEPPVQLATVVLHYAQIDRGHYAQAYALLSEGFQNANPFEAWAAGFSSTASVSVQSVSTGADIDEVNVRIEAIDTVVGVSSATVFEGVWTLVEEGGAWRLNAASISVVGQ